MLDVARTEYKYPLTLWEAEMLAAKLSGILEEDPHNGMNGYTIRSLYFDTLHDTDFEEKADGIDDRKKIRLRIYDASDRIIKLELKAKSGDFQRKRSLTLTRQQADEMIAGRYDFLLEQSDAFGENQDFAEYLYSLMTTMHYVPKCIVEYDRKAFIGEVNDTRITFDRNLRACEGTLELFQKELPLYPVSPAGDVTLEVKFNGFLASHIKKICSISDRTRMSISKYTRCRMLTKAGRF